MSVSTPRRSTRLCVPVAAICVAVLVGCASAPRKGHRSPQDISGGTAAVVAELKTRFDAGQFEAADSLARALLTADPDNPQADEVLFVAARASSSLESWVQTVKYAEELSSKYPLSPHREEGMLLAAEAYRKFERYYESAEVLSRLLSSPVDPDLERRSLVELRRVTGDKLTPAELERLVRAFPTSPLVGEVSFKLAREEFARGNYERSYGLLADLLYQFPQHSRAREIRYLLEVSASRRQDPSRTPTYLEPHAIGVLLPQTGEYSRFGRSFEEGVRLAIDEYNASADAPVSCVLGDSKADPIAAVTAVRKLIVENGVVAVVGSVFTIPSIAAATECNAWKVPIVSPLVRDPAFREIGPWVFQTQLPVEVELAAMARLAVRDLLLERIAVFASSTPEGRRLSAFFTGEVERLGGDVVIEEFYGARDTDFKQQIERIRGEAPDGIFLPGGPDELVNILPQIRFYDIQIQLLGLSSWNSDKLLRLAERELEGAVFPSEGYHGREPDAYERFAANYLNARAKGHGTDEIGDVSPVAAAGYFGTRFVLDAIAGGAVDREQVKERLDAELNADADVRLKEVESLPMLRVVSGKAHAFKPPKRD